jgi:hypothetical protein
MIRYRKIRGHKRRQKQVEQWRLDNLQLKIDILEQFKKDHIDIVVHPWCDFSIINSGFASPKSKTKQLIINALLDIYDSLKIQLDKLDKPYYLKIWLYEERFTKSQVVLAIDNKIEFYQNCFSKPDMETQINKNTFGRHKRIENYLWEERVDEQFYDNTTLGDPEDYESLEDFIEAKKWFNNLMKKNHKTYYPENPTDDFFEFYGFRMGKVWIGGSK